MMKSGVTDFFTDTAGLRTSSAADAGAVAPEIAAFTSLISAGRSLTGTVLLLT